VVRDTILDSTRATGPDPSDEATDGAERRPAVAILSYHKIGEPPDDGWESWYYVPCATFREQLQTLLSAGWPPIDHTTFADALDRPERLPDRCALVTFDDGYRSLVRDAIPILDELGIPSVVFVPTAHIGGTNAFDIDEEPEEEICDWDDLRFLARHDMSVQSHGVRHVPMSTIDPDAQAEELRASRQQLESGLETTVDLFAFPYGDEGPDPLFMRASLRASGYRAAFAYGGGPADLRRDDHFALPRLAMGPDTDLAALLA
jgi:peptidoglycan/xylan/chitin deacetylase (PgdA/CDA1 family)